MGTKIRSFGPLPRDLSLEDLVPEDHLYRRLEAALDLSFGRRLVAPLYTSGGRPSVDPIVFFKLQLVMFFEDLRSERQLMRMVSARLSSSRSRSTPRSPASANDSAWGSPGASSSGSSSSPMHQKKKSASGLGYQTHYVVDGGKARVILDVLVTPAEVTENLPMLDLLFRSCFRWHLQPRSATGDATYDTKENIAAIENANIRAYTALADQQGRTSLFTIDAFEYDPLKDLYTCPAGETLRRRGHDHRGSYVRYAAKASACNECSLKSKCTKGPKGRWMSRCLEEEYLERIRAYCETEPCRKALRKRAVWIEPLFGEAKEWHGFGRFRGLEKVNSEALMIASGQNVKRLLAFGSRAPRRVAQVAALRRPEAGRPEVHGVPRHRGRCIWAPARPFSTRCVLPRTRVNRPPGGAAESARWHHAHGVDPCEERRLARRNLYVSREEQSPGSPLPGSAC